MGLTTRIINKTAHARRSRVVKDFNHGAQLLGRLELLVKRMQQLKEDPCLCGGATLGTMGGGISKSEFPMPSPDINDQKGMWPQYAYPPPEQEIAVPRRSSAVHAENMDQNIIGRFFSSISSIVEIPSPKGEANSPSILDS